MTEDVLTFEELRRVQTRERDSDTLQELDEEFFDRARRYLDLKREGGDHLQNQEYRNARNILQDILDTRQKKIVKLAFLSVKSGVNVENLLSGEKELFKEIEETIGSYRHDLNEEIFETDLDVSTDTGEEAVEVEVEAEAGEGSVSEDETEEKPGPEVEEDTEPVAEEDPGPVTEKGEDAEEEDEDEEERVSEEDEQSERSEESAKILEEEGYEDLENENTIDGDTVSEEGTEEESERSEDGEFVRVVMNQDVPEFMGTDLNVYGPFEEGEEAEVPEENSEVLVEQGKAEIAD